MYSVIKPVLTLGDDGPRESGLYVVEWVDSRGRHAELFPSWETALTYRNVLSRMDDEDED